MVFHFRYTSFLDVFFPLKDDRKVNKVAYTDTSMISGFKLARNYKLILTNHADPPVWLGIWLFQSEWPMFFAADCYLHRILNVESSDHGSFRVEIGYSATGIVIMNYKSCTHRSEWQPLVFLLWLTSFHELINSSGIVRCYVGIHWRHKRAVNTTLHDLREWRCHYRALWHVL